MANILGFLLCSGLAIVLFVLPPIRYLEKATKRGYYEDE